MKEYVLGFLLVITRTVEMMAVENLTKDKTLMFISEETGMTQYCEFGPLSSVTSTETNGELSTQCYHRNKNMRHILPDGTVLYPYLKPMSNKGRVLHCEEMQNVSLINCDRRVYSVCNFSCPHGFTPLSNTTTCNLLGPLKNVTVEWSNSRQLCALDPVKDTSPSVLENTDHTQMVAGVCSAGVAVLIIITLIALYCCRRKSGRKINKDENQIDAPQENPPQRNPQAQVDGENMELDIDLPQYVPPAQVPQRNSQDFEIDPPQENPPQRNPEVKVDGENMAQGLPELPMNYYFHDAHQTDKDTDHKAMDERLKKIVNDFKDNKLESDKGAVPNLATAETAPLLEQSGQRLGPCVTSVNLFLKQRKSFVDSLSGCLETIEGRPHSQTIRGFVKENLEKLKFKDLNDFKLFLTRCKQGYEVEEFLICMAGADVFIGDFLDYCYTHDIQNVIDIVLSVHKDCDYCHQYSARK